MIAVSLGVKHSRLEFSAAVKRGPEDHELCM
jgi:hypothetical protein